MNFNSIIGQQEVKQRLRSMVSENRVPHALMLCGPSGVGKLPLALAFARFLLCQKSGETDMFGGTPEDCCGECQECKMTELWAHPDLHFSFPVYKKKSTDHPVSDDYLDEWRDQLNRNVYFDIEDWLTDIKAENQQIVHYVNESDALQQKLALKPARGGRRVVIIWLPERMMTQAANKLLKLIEEPPAQTYFLLVSEDSEKVLGTIQSRTQRLNVPFLSEEEITDALMRNLALPEAEAKVMAHVSQGSYTTALKRLAAGNEEQLFFDLFVQLMRLAYMRKIKDLRAWSETIAEMGRERQKRLLEYCQKLIRENFIYNFRKPEMNFQTLDESNFSVRFARFINEKNVMPIMDELSLCQRDIEQNVNPKMVFFDFALKMIVLLIQ